MFLSQRKYVVEILERAHMVNCNPSRTPVDTESKLGDDVQQGTLDHGLQLFSSSTTSLVAYSDADWAGFPATRRSTSVFAYFLATTYSLSPLRINRRFLVLAQMQRIMVLPMLLRRLVG
ncbi:ribonuclease H-like domain-containing protein [Tanacetum coccineum]